MECLFDRRERLACLRPESPRDLTESVQDIFSSRDLDLLLIQKGSGVAGPGPQAHDVFAPKLGNRAFQNCGAGGPLTDLLRDRRGQPGVFRVSHQLQHVSDLLVRRSG